MSSERYVWLADSTPLWRAEKSGNGLRRGLEQSAPLEQAVGRRQATAEQGVELGRIACAAGRVDVRVQLARGRAVEDVAALLERGEGVGVEHLRPHVAVIARGVTAAGEDVPEMGGAVPHHDLGRHADARE